MPELKLQTLREEQKGLGPWGLEAESHWRENLPKLYQGLKKAGKLRQALLNAQSRTEAAYRKEKEKLEKQGRDPSEAGQIALELVREQWVYLPAEEDQQDSESLIENLL